MLVLIKNKDSFLKISSYKKINTNIILIYRG
jgi:hypothetical protein